MDYASVYMQCAARTTSLLSPKPVFSRAGGADCRYRRSRPRQPAAPPFLQPAAPTGVHFVSLYRQQAIIRIRMDQIGRRRKMLKAAINRTGSLPPNSPEPA